MKAMRQLGQKIRKRKLEMERRKNQKKYIVEELLEEILVAAGDELFNTPVPSVIPTDSFAEDFEPEFFINTGRDLSLKSINSVNRETADGDRSTVMSSQKKRLECCGGKKSSDSKSSKYLRLKNQSRSGSKMNKNGRHSRNNSIGMSKGAPNYQLKTAGQ